MTTPQSSEHGSPRHSRTLDRDRYPMDHLIGVLDTQATFDAVFASLIAAGIPEIDILVGTGDDGGPAPMVPDRSKILEMLLRVAHWIGFIDEGAAVKTMYEEAMRANRFVICIAVPTVERRRIATQVLQAQGAHAVKFMGDMRMEDVEPLK